MGSRGGRLGRALALVSLLVAVGTLQPAQASQSRTTRAHAAGVRGQIAAKGFFDARAAGSAAPLLQTRDARQAASPSVAVSSMRRSLGREGVLDIDAMTGTPRIVARLDGFLTKASSAPAASVALGFVRAHSRVFKLGARSLERLRLTRDYVDVAGTHHLSWAQTLKGVPLFGNGLEASVSADGRLVNVLGSPVADLGDVSTRPRLSASAALAAARADVGARATPSDRASRVLFQTTSGTRLGWQTIVMSRPAYEHVIDAQTGAVLYRRSLTDSANGLAWDVFPGTHKGGVQKLRDFTARGWLSQHPRKLSGNNTHTYNDVDSDFVAEPNEEIRPGANGDFLFHFKPFHLPGFSCTPNFPCGWNPNVPFSWRTNFNQAGTQVFFYVNRYHDHLAARPIGFTEAAGNFERVNRSGQGEGGDPVQAHNDDGANTLRDAQGNLVGLPDGGHIDNAFMSTPPDGTPPDLAVFLVHQPFTTLDEDPFHPVQGGDDALTIYHEYTHGLSNRLVVDALGNSTLGDVQAGAMGEAWSDWYAFDFLANQGYLVDTKVPGNLDLDVYWAPHIIGLSRTEAIDCPVGVTSRGCPNGGYTYADYGKIVGRPEVHADGEIWGQTLWDLRAAIGPKLSEKLVTRAMELSPANPSYLDMRNAILQADVVTNDRKAHDAIWRVFAHRGMGYFAAAVSGNDAHPVADFHVPPSGNAARGSFSGRVVDTLTGQPASGVSVFFGGHASGFPGANLADTTDRQGRFLIRGIFPGTYRDVVVFEPGFDRIVRTVTIRAGANPAGAAIRLVRDWASALGGARVTAFTGPNFGGCGTTAAIDQEPDLGWSSTSDLASNGKPSKRTPKSFVVALPGSVDVTSFLVDPSNTCGDAPSAATGPFQIATSTDGQTFRVVARGRFTPADLGRLNAVRPSAGVVRNVRFVRFTMLAPQVFQIPGASCPGPFDGCSFMDMSELSVHGSPS